MRLLSSLLFLYLCLLVLPFIVIIEAEGSVNETFEDREIQNFVASRSFGDAFSVVLSPLDHSTAPEHLDLFNFMLFHNGSKLDLFEAAILSSGTEVDPRHSLFVDFLPFSHWRNTRMARQSFGPLLVFTVSEPFDRVRIYNTKDACCGDNLIEHFRLRVLRHWTEPVNDNNDNNVNRTLTEELWSMSFKEMTNGSFSSIGDSTQTPLIFEVDINMVHNSPQTTIVDAEEASLFVSNPQPQYTFTPTVMYYSRFSHNGQDEKVLEHTRFKRGGTYIDIGANDGVRHSNTYALEKYFGWSGLLVEPLSRLLKSLVINRSERNHFLSACVYDRTFNAEFMETDGEGEFSGVAESWPWYVNNAYNTKNWKTSVPCFHIQDVLKAHNYTQVDYLSVDAEGADLIILEAIDWTSFSADIVSVECHPHEIEKENALRELFIQRLNFSKIERLDWDLMFFK